MTTAVSTKSSNGQRHLWRERVGEVRLNTPIVLRPEMFGALTEEADCTVQVQNMVDEAARLDAVIDGHGRQYNVGTVKWPGGSKARDLRLKCLAATTDLTAPVTIDGVTDSERAYRFRNVHVDGNRANHAGIATTTEDGGRHGWRLIGRVSDLLAIACSAINCAGDGLALFSSTERGTRDSDRCFGDVVFVNFRSEGNRFLAPMTSKKRISLWL